MNEVSYFTIRAQHHSQLALEASDPRLKAAYEAIAADMSAKVATADPNRKVVLIDGVAVDAHGLAVNVRQASGGTSANGPPA
jgi:hypothetical protein